MNAVLTLIPWLKQLSQYYMKRKLTEAEGRITIEQTRAKAEALVLTKKAEHIAEWETIQAEASKTSWKDEFWTFILACPLILLFIPQTSDFALEGLRRLHEAPEWYLMALSAAIAAAFGIRMGIVDGLKRPFQRRKENTDGNQ